MTNSTLESRPNTLAAIGSSGAALRLLVSVRGPDEAAAALAGGASVIDVKEPANGPLGAASVAAIRSVIEVVAGRVPVTAALGELADLKEQSEAIPGLAAAKVGLSGLSDTDWRARFNDVRQNAAGTAPLVPAAYADALRAGSPPVIEVIRFAIEHDIGWMVLDTWDKSRGDLFDSLPADEVASMLDTARKSGLNVVLAGSLRGEAIARACQLKPTLVGVRGAACVGGRGGTVCANLVRNVRQQLDSCRLAP